MKKKKRCTSPSKPCSLNCVIRRLVPGGRVLLKQVAEDASGVTKIIHNLKDNTSVQKKRDIFTNLVHSAKNHRKTTCNKPAGILSQFVTVYFGWAWSSV